METNNTLLYIKNIFFIFFFSFCFSLNAQDHIQFRSYTISDGLSQSTVSSMMQDQLGALWIGTQDGINRFNGKSFESFSINNGYSVSNEFINTGFKDRKENMWFGTANGITKYNPRSVAFSAFYIDSTRRIDIQAIAEDVKGNLWIGTNYGDIYQFNTEEEIFYLRDKTSFNSRIVRIVFTPEKMLFISEFDGVLFADLTFENKKIIRIKSQNSSELKIYNTINSPDYDIVISTNQGVFYFDENTQQFLPDPGFINKLKDIAIVDAIFLSKNKVLIASEHSGLFQILKDEKDSLHIINYSADIFQKGSLISNKLTKLFWDNQGLVWIASQQGISSFNPKYLGFKGVGISPNPNNGLPTQNVWGFSESANEQFLYIATDVGVSCFDRFHHRYYHYHRKTRESEDQTSLSLLVMEDNKLLVGSLDGLFELNINPENPADYTYTKFEHLPEIPRGFDVSYTILPADQEHQYWIGTKSGIALFDNQTKKFRYLMNEPNVPHTISPGACRFIFKANGNYYASPSSGGIYQLKEENEKIIALSNNDFTPLNENANNYFTSVYQANENEFWFGTAGDGLFHYNRETKAVKKYNKSNGLPNNVIYGVVATSQNSRYIWLSTNRGVAAFDTKGEVSYNFTEKDGLLSHELNLGASFVAKNKEIYFGGIQGFNYFNPETSFYLNNNLRVYFSWIEIDNEPIFPSENGILTQSIAFTKQILLPYNKKSLKLRFFANDLSNPERIEYKYVVSGDENVEEFLGNSNEIRFAALAPGTYTLEVYARFVNGEWNKLPAKLIIERETPFWLKWWFYVVSFIIVSLVVVYRVRKNIDEGRRRQVRLEMRIAERTRELRKKNEKIKQQRNRLMKQTEELELEKEKSERLLNNMLPQETASLLKEGEKATAREYQKVSIMFTDFVGFSKIAEEMTAQELVSILDKHFRKFDEIIEKNNLEKIKTIGDAYMSAGGVPIRNKTNPINTVLAAVQIKFYMLEQKEIKIKNGEKYWELRIGVNTGSASAGVIGTKKYAYDVWGSTVNRAQRMEELCEPGKIAITQATFDYIEPYFECKLVGKVKTKSGIKIKMYEVISIKPELSIDEKGIEPNEAFNKLVNLHHYSKINYMKAERFILHKLKNELDPKLHYHSYKHSKDVTRQIERIAIGEGITDEDLFLLKSAASYHDAGFVEQYEKNETIGARMAAEILPNFGYTETDIEQIKRLIFVTEVPHKPQNLLEQIICDADLDYLGRDDFHAISDKLKRELKEHGKIESDKQWDEMQVKFFHLHRYFTKTAIETRAAKKQQNLDEILQRLKEDNYSSEN